MVVEAIAVVDIVAGLAGLDTIAYSIGSITGWANEYFRVIRDAAARV
ncbi:hypothetical protein [Leifsonia sp. AG29]|nr:hypothetical protein [Leifsonia sp. AG29]